MMEIKNRKDYFGFLILMVVLSCAPKTTEKIAAAKPTKIAKPKGTPVTCTNNVSVIDNNDFTITDPLTGLIWKKCSEGQNNDDTCSAQTSYTIYGKTFPARSYQYCKVNNNSCNGGVNHGILTGGPAFNACNELNKNAGFAGQNNWRVPTRMELWDFRRKVWKHCRKAFPNTVLSLYWPSSGYEGTVYNAYYVAFVSENSKLATKFNTYALRCVSSGTDSK